MSTDTLMFSASEHGQAMHAKVKAFIVPELNLGQIVGEVERAARKGTADVLPINRVDGKLITPEEIIAAAGRI